MTLREQIDGARLVMAHNEACVPLTLAWHGGTGIHVYTDAGEEVHYWMLGGSNTNANPERIRESMIAYIEGEGDDDDAA